MELNILGSKDESIEAVLPDIEPGTYRLLVADWRMKQLHLQRMDIIDVTLRVRKVTREIEVIPANRGRRRRADGRPIATTIRGFGDS
jgi:hypothetical protein